MFNTLVGIKTFMDTNNGQYFFKKMRENVKKTHKDKRQKILKNEGMVTKTEEQYLQKYMYKNKQKVKMRIRK